MSGLIVDTDVVSFLFKNDSRAEDYLRFLEGQLCFISFMTEAEMELWTLIAGWGPPRIARFQQFLRLFTVVPSSRDLVVAWAQVMSASRKRGRRLETADAWIAATALLHDVPLVTHNASDYEGVPDLRIITRNP